MTMSMETNIEYGSLDFCMESNIGYGTMTNSMGTCFGL